MCASEIIAFTSKPNGATVDIGRGMATVECRKTVLAVHAPISFVLLEGNEAAEERPSLVHRDPHAAGWMARVRPTRWEAERPGLIQSRAQLEERLYGWQEDIESNAIEVHVHNLRQKLGRDVIETVRGLGYRLRQSP